MGKVIKLPAPRARTAKAQGPKRKPEIIDLTDILESRAKERKASQFRAKRTPEMAFIVAIIRFLPAEIRKEVLFTVAMLGDRMPDSEATVAAAELALSMSLTWD